MHCIVVFPLESFACVENLHEDAAALLRQLSYYVVVRYPTTGQAVPHRTNFKEKCKKFLYDAGEPAPEDL